MHYDLTNQHDLQKLLGQKGLTPQKTAGQHFLLCREVVEATVVALTDGPKAVTELGAGLGILTQELLGADLRVRAIERDDQLAKILPNLVPRAWRERLDLQVTDLRKGVWEWEEPYFVVGNIPYNLSGLIVRRITQLEPEPEQVVLLVQQEVAERICADVPNMHLISLAVRLWGEATTLLTVPPDCFWPTPKVHSQLVLLWPREKDRLETGEREAVLAVARPFFQQRRKQMGGVLRREWQLGASEAQAVLEVAGIPETVRPQEVAVTAWRALYRSLAKREAQK